MDKVRKLEEDVVEAETKLLDDLIENIDILSDEYIRMSLTQIKLSRQIVRHSRMLEFRRKYLKD